MKIGRGAAVGQERGTESGEEGVADLRPGRERGGIVQEVNRQ